MTISINNLINDLSTRSARAILSQLGLRSHTLRDYLGELFAQKPGAPGALLAEPVLEAAFGWKTADRTMAELARDDVLHRKLVAALDRPAREYREQASRSGADPTSTSSTAGKCCSTAHPIRPREQRHGLWQDGVLPRAHP